jgi:hypothetical protein
MGATVLLDDGHHNKNGYDGAGGGDRDNGDGGNVTGGKKRRGRMKGGAKTMTDLSNFDVDVTGHCIRGKRGRGNGPA